MKRKPGIGDWVRFQRDASLVLAVVEYVFPSDYGHYDWRVVTTAGEIPDTAILETRTQQESR